jgi:hypothetical protein
VFNRIAVATGAVAAIVALSSGVAALIFGLWPDLRPDPPPEQLSASIGKLAVEPSVSFGEYLARIGALDEYRRLRTELVRSVVTPRLMPGAQGPQVATLQRLLLQQGVYSGPVSGSYSPATVAAVKKFQKQGQTEADGIVGPQTLRVLIQTNPTSFARAGMVLYVGVKVEGFRIRHFGPLQANLYDADTGIRVRERGAVPLTQLLRPVLSPEKADAVIRIGEITQSRARVRPAAPIDQRGKLLWLPSPHRHGRFFVRVELYDLAGELVNFADSKAFRLAAGK